MLWGELTENRYCNVCRRRTAWLPSQGCVVCSAKEGSSSKLVKDSYKEVSYSTHSVEECMRDEDREVAERLRLLENGINQHIKPEPSIEDLLSHQDCH